MTAARLLLIDNHDSFTYNLAQAFAAAGVTVEVVLSDDPILSEPAALRRYAPDYLVISPGPGGPSATGISGAAVDHYRGRIPVLGVCLGHQLLAVRCGAQVSPTGAPVHGHPWRVHHRGGGIFAGLPSPFEAARYHSLAVTCEALPDAVVPLAWTEEGLLMGFGVPGEATWGVQFHPESFLTPEGPRLLAAFLTGQRCEPSTAGSLPW